MYTYTKAMRAKIMGMLVFVYRNGLGDTTANGISSRVDQLVVENVDGPFTADERTPGVRLVVKNGRARLELLDAADSQIAMFGGNYAGTSDSRWSRALEQLVGYAAGVVPVFDRIEK